MRKLVVFDIETTGLDKQKDYIIQFSAVKYDRETEEIVDEYDTYVQPSGNYTMSLQALLKHHITPKFLNDKPTFVEVASDILEFMDGCDLLSYNGLSFDAPFLKREFKDCGLDWSFAENDFYDAFLEEQRRNSNKLESTFKRYTGKSMEDAGYTAHNSLSDVKATLEVFNAQQKEAEYGPEEILTEDGFIKKMEFNGNIEECFSVGKYSCVSIEYVAKTDKRYLNWVVNNPDFDSNTKNIVSKYL